MTTSTLTNKKYAKKPDTPAESAEESVSRVLRYFDERYWMFMFWFDKTATDFGKEDLHKLRVEIKKLRAFLRFHELNLSGEYNKKQHFKVLARLFKPGGALRETQMNRSILKRYRTHHLPEYEAYLQKLEEKQTRKLKRAMRQFDLDELGQHNQGVAEILEGMTTDSVINGAKAFINSELEAIRALRNKLENDEDLHQVRTHTKALGYIAKLTNQLQPSEQLALLLSSAKTAEKLIGNWHDRLVLRDSLVRFVKKNPDSADREKINKLVKQIEYRNRKSVEAIAERLDTYSHIKL